MITIRFCLDFGEHTLGNSIIGTEKSEFLYLFRSRGILSDKYGMKGGSLLPFTPDFLPCVNLP